VSPACPGCLRLTRTTHDWHRGLSYSSFEIKWTKAGRQRTLLCIDDDCGGADAATAAAADDDHQRWHAASRGRELAESATVTNTGRVAAAKVCAQLTQTPRPNNNAAHRPPAPPPSLAFRRGFHHDVCFWTRH
jgi:hypothetical protein